MAVWLSLDPTFPCYCHKWGSVRRSGMLEAEGHGGPRLALAKSLERLEANNNFIFERWEII